MRREAIAITLPLILILPGGGTHSTAAAVAPGEPPASQPMSLDLDEAYIDGSFGFSVTPPAGSTVTRQKRLSGVADVELVQFSNEQRHWTLTVRQTTTTQPLDSKSIIEGITKGVGTRFTNVQMLRGEEVRIDAREGVRYAASFAGQGSIWLRQQAVIRTKPNEYFALVFITPYDVRDSAEQLFDKVVASFHIIRTEAMSKRLEAGLQRGRRLLEHVADGKGKLSERIIPESFMRLILGGKEIGYVWIQERAIDHHKHTGIGILETAFLFKEDGSLTQLQHEMQLTDDLTFEEWRNHVKTLTPAKGNEQRRLIYQVDSGLRQDRQLLVAFMPVPNAPELQDRALDVDANYASAAWQGVMPRVVDLKRPELYAFSAYDWDRRGMVLRTVEVVGPAQVTISGRATQVIKLQDSEGLLPPISEVDVDSSGRILRVKSGPLEMIAATKQELQSQYAQRVTDAEALFKKYPAREPQPARHEHQPAPSVSNQTSPPGAVHE